ncbi:MAG: transposase [Planctomycetia bacterium]|nr:transposase [Planctomycetia bacterium]
MKDVKYIAIDEIATKKGHVYMTIVLDLETGLVLYVEKGRDQNALLPFWKKLKKSRAKILAVATDMSPAYTAAVKEHLPDAIHVHDRFHVVKMFNEVINKMRCSIARKIKDKDEKSELKGIRYILLKRPENLDPNKGEPQRLEKALKMNEDLSMIYYLKEELHSLWEEDELVLGVFYNWSCQKFRKTLKYLKFPFDTFEVFHEKIHYSFNGRRTPSIERFRQKTKGEISPSSPRANFA